MARIEISAKAELIPICFNCSWIWTAQLLWHRRVGVLDAQILEGMPMTSEVEEFLRVIGPFYELVEEKKKISRVSDLNTGMVFL